jgi:steroid 5-alpha reductase family enzyme
VTGPAEDQVQVGPRRSLSRAASFGVVLIAYLAALLVAVGAGALVVDGHSLRTVLVGVVASALTIFVFSRAVNNTSMFDAWWSVAPPAVAVYLVAVSEPGVSGARQALVVALVFAWAIRLTSNWARGWPGLGHEDWRYTAMRGNGHSYWLQSLFGLHLVPALEVYLGCLSLYPALTVGANALGPLDLLAAIVTGGAVVLELVADEQLRAFNRTKAPGEICAVGLWSWSRHPNYLGEISFWWGLWLFGLSAAPGYWWTVVGPLAITVLFATASIPMLEKRSAERRPDWDDYRRRTSVLLPRPPRSR